MKSLSPSSTRCPRCGPGGDRGAFCVFCYLNKRRRANYPGHSHYVSRPSVRFYQEYIMKRETPVKTPKKGEISCPDPEFGTLYPSVTRYLLDSWWDDGKPREVSALNVKMDDSYVHVGLMDYDQERSVYCTAPTLPEALGMLEALLADGRVSWRQWKKGKK